MTPNMALKIAMNENSGQLAARLCELYECIAKSEDRARAVEVERDALKAELDAMKKAAGRCENCEHSFEEIYDLCDSVGEPEKEQWTCEKFDFATTPKHSCAAHQERKS